MVAAVRRISARRMLVDQKSVDLAEHFLADVKGHTAAHVRELAEAIQTTCEDLCSMAEADVSEERRETAEGER